MKKNDQTKWLTAEQLAKVPRGADYEKRKAAMKAAIGAANEALRKRLQNVRAKS